MATHDAGSDGHLPSAEGPADLSGPSAPAELVVVSRADASLRAHGTQVASLAGADTAPLSQLLQDEGLVMEPMFGPSEDQVQADVRGLASDADGADLPDLSVFYRVEAPAERLGELAERFNAIDQIAGAYVQPVTAVASAPPVDSDLDADLVVETAAGLNTMTPAEELAPSTTPSFVNRQGYLTAAPTGINAPYAWTQRGGKGSNVRVIDIEWGWRFNHEDLRLNQGGVLSGTNSTDDNHGTAVIGEIGGDENAFGVTGIAPDAWVAAVSLVTHSVAAAIKIAADQLRPGDIMLLEVQRWGPKSRWLPVEWWPADFEAIRYAIAKGVVVVEAGGNGGENLDDPFYNTPQAGFPASWRNPFNMANPSSGAVMVGAGNPPAGTHGRTTYGGDALVDRARCNFSNYGARVDAQGWGWLVTTTGYGDLQGQQPPPVSLKDRWYTDLFSGTSSASPIVVGALACVQGVLRANRRIPLSPARARELLRATGSPQQDGPGRPRSQRIGNRPNLAQLIPAALHTDKWLGVQFTGTVPANATRRWFTFRWPAHWHVVWTVVPTSPKAGGPQISWDVQVERAEDAFITYWISITNVTGEDVDIEARYAVLGW